MRCVVPSRLLSKQKKVMKMLVVITTDCSVPGGCSPRSKRMQWKQTSEKQLLCDLESPRAHSNEMEQSQLSAETPGVVRLESSHALRVNRLWSACSLSLPTVWYRSPAPCEAGPAVQDFKVGRDSPLTHAGTHHRPAQPPGVFGQAADTGPPGTAQCQAFSHEGS